MEDSFGINNVALVGGQPQTLGLKDLLRHYVDFRIDVVRRRTAFRLRKAQDRLHLVEGLLIAILDIDEVIHHPWQRGHRHRAGPPHGRLRPQRDAGQPHPRPPPPPADEVLAARASSSAATSLQKQIEEPRGHPRRREACSTAPCRASLAEVAKKYGTPRRTVLLESAGNPVSTAAPLEVSDDPCHVLLSSTGLLARTSTAEPIPAEGPRAKHDAVIAAVRTTARGEVGLVTSLGRMIRISALEAPDPAPARWRPLAVGRRPARGLRRPAPR